MRSSILVVANDVAARARLGRRLMKAGYAVELAESVRHARRVLGGKTLELAVVVPEGLGSEAVELVEELRAAVGKPPLVVSADADGLLAEIEAVLRAPAPEPVASVPRFAGFALDLDGRTLTGRDGREIALTRNEFTLLRELACSPGKVLSRDRLGRALGGRSVEAYERGIDMLVVRLRRKIEPDPKHPSLIVTVPGSGYKLAAGTSPEQAAPGGAHHPHRAARFLVPALAAFLILLVIGGLWQLRPAAPPPKERPAIAVLPFDDDGADPATGRLASGVTNDIITDLARSRGLDMIARSSTEAYAEKPVDVRDIGRELGVGYVLEGSIQRQDDHVRVTAWLVDARNGTHVWTNRWDRPAADVFAVQAEVAKQVAAALGTPLGLGVIGAHERERVLRRLPANLDAYDHYLLAAEAKARRTPEGIREGMAQVEQAIALDPALARAYVLRGYLHFYTFTNGAADFATAMRAVEADFTKAVALDPSDAEAHAALAFYDGQIGRFAASEAEIRLAVATSPSDSHVLGLAAATLPYLGYPDEAAGYADKALRLDPNMGSANLTSLKDAYYFARRFEDTLRVIERIPPPARSQGSLLLRAASLAMLGRPRDEVAQARAAMLAREPDISIELLLNRDWLFARPQERDLFVDGLRKAGFPACAMPEAPTKTENPIRLPECTAPRAAAAAVKP